MLVSYKSKMEGSFSTSFDMEIKYQVELVIVTIFGSFLSLQISTLPLLSTYYNLLTTT